MNLEKIQQQDLEHADIKKIQNLYYVNGANYT